MIGARRLMTMMTEQAPEPIDPDVIRRLEEAVGPDRDATREEVLKHLGTPQLEAFWRRRLQLILARIQVDAGEYSEALEGARDLLDVAIGAGDSEVVGGARNTLGLTYWKLGDLPQALDCFQAALRLAQEGGWQRLALRASANLGVIHAGQKQWSEAEAVYRQTYALAESLKEPRLKAVIAHNLALVLWERDGPTDAALAFNEEAYQGKLPFGDAISLTQTLNNRVGLLCDRADWPAAGEALEEARTWTARADTVSTWFFFELNRSRFLLALENPAREDEEGFRALGQALEWARKGKLREEEARAHDYFARAYGARGEHREAYEHLRKHLEVQQQWLTAQTAQRIENLRNAFAVENLEQEHRQERRRREELESLNAELTRIGKEKDHLLSLLGHDLRSQVGAMTSLAEFILETTEEGETAHECGRDILNAGTATLDLLEQILTHGSAREGAFSERAQVDLNALLDAVAKRVDAIFRHKDQVLRRAYGQDCVELTTNAVGLQRILENLLTNASKYSPRGTATTLSLEVGETDCRIRVIDQGLGVPPKEAGSLFSAGTPLSVKPTDGEPSTGFGLFLCREIADKLEAALDFAPTPGGGSTFSIRIPREPSRVARAVPSASEGGKEESRTNGNRP